MGTVPPEDDNLSAQEIEALGRAIARIQKKRRIRLVGLGLSAFFLLFGMLAALYVYGSTPKGTFVGWVFFIPFGAVGAILWLFGRWARKT